MASTFQESNPAMGQATKETTAQHRHGIGSQQAEGLHTDTVPCHAQTAGQEGDSRHTYDQDRTQSGWARGREGGQVGGALQPGGGASALALSPPRWPALSKLEPQERPCPSHPRADWPLASSHTTGWGRGCLTLGQRLSVGQAIRPAGLSFPTSSAVWDPQGHPWVGPKRTPIHRRCSRPPSTWKPSWAFPGALLGPELPLPPEGPQDLPHPGSGPWAQRHRTHDWPVAGLRPSRGLLALNV